jgi:hypothetical protein
LFVVNRWRSQKSDRRQRPQKLLALLFARCQPKNFIVLNSVSLYETKLSFVAAGRVIVSYIETRFRYANAYGNTSEIGKQGRRSGKRPVTENRKIWHATPTSRGNRKGSADT